MSGGDFTRALAVEEGTPLAEALAARAELMALSQASHDAVLTPKAPGGLSPAERAAFAARMARQNADDELAGHYDAMLDRAGPPGGLAEVAAGDAAGGDDRLAVLVRHVDLLTLDPKAATRDSIRALEAAGIAQADIVRLSELCAFVNYQVRVLAGLRLLKADSHG